MRAAAKKRKNKEKAVVATSFYESRHERFRIIIVVSCMSSPCFFTHQQVSNSQQKVNQFM